MEKKRKGRGRQIPGTTQDEQLLESPRADEFTHTDPWRVFRIMGEFVEGFDELATLSRGIRRPDRRCSRRSTFQPPPLHQLLGVSMTRACPRLG